MENKRDINAAIWYYQKALKMAPAYDRYKIHIRLGNALAQKGRLRDAIPHLLIAAKLDPQNDEVQYNLATAFAGKGLINEAILHFQTALAII